MSCEPLESEPLRFVHAANLRLGGHIEQVAEWTPAQRSVVADAGFLAFENLMDLCLETQADFLLVSGDSCTDTADWRIAVAVRRGLERLHQHGVHVFVVGCAAAGSQIWLGLGDDCDNLTVLDADDTEPVAFVRGRRAVAALQNHILCDADEDASAADCADGNTSDSTSRQPFRIGILAADSSMAMSAGPSDGGHLDRVDSETGRADSEEVTEMLPAEVVAEFAGVSLVDYVALADGDRPRRVRLRSRDQIASFPGTLQPSSFAEADWGGCTIVDVDRRGQAECRQVAVSAVDWVCCPLIWRPGALIAELAAGAIRQFLQQPPQASARLCVVQWDVRLAEPEQVAGGADFESEAIGAFEKALRGSQHLTGLPPIVHHWEWSVCAEEASRVRSGVLALLDDAWDQIAAAPDAELRRLVHEDFASDEAILHAMDTVLDALDVDTLQGAVNQLVAQWFESPADQGAA